MIRKILVPANDNNFSANALETAIQIARDNKAILQILHITDYNSSDYHRSQDNAKTRYVYDAMAGRIFQKHAVSTEIIFAEGSRGPVIVRIAFEKRPQLIIMDSLVGSEFKKEGSFIGPTANYVVRNAECPVLIMPAGKKIRRFETVLFPVRSGNGTLKQFAFVRDITCASGEKCQFEILALLVDSPTQGMDHISGIVDDVEKGMSGQEDVKVSLSYNVGVHIADEVLEKADQINADLLVIPSAIDTDKHAYYIGPCSQQIINRTRIPFLRVHSA